MSKENQGNSVNLICEGTLILGDIKTKNDIRIDGMIKGKVFTSGRLIIGNTATVEGNINCLNIDIHGTVVGDIIATGAVSLKKPCKVMGNIISNIISIDSGSTFNGNCQMQKKESKEGSK